MMLARRRFIQGASTATVGGLLGARLSAQEAAPVPQLSAYQVGPQIWVRCGGVTLTCYRAHPTQKYPYFFPLAGPATGQSLTTESSEPYPHHRSVMFACDRVNGADYWQEGLERGQIVSRGPTVEASEAGRVVIVDACDWRMGNGPVDLLDQRRFTLSAPSAEVRLLEADITLTAARDVHIERTNHSLFAIRCAPELSPKAGGMLVNSEGLNGEKATFGQKAAWCAFFGERFGATEGVALMDHPQNPWSPCTWFTRDYGFISPTPMNWLPDQGLSLASGSSLRLRYLVVAFAGTPESADLAGVYARWTAG
jgi:hypothetical protein